MSITALFVGGPEHAIEKSLPRAFKTTGCIEWDGTRNHRVVYELDLVNFEPYVYVLRGLKARDRDRLHREAVELSASTREIRARIFGARRNRSLA